MLCIRVLGLGTELGVPTATRHELSLIGVVSVVARHLLPAAASQGIGLTQPLTLAKMDCNQWVTRTQIEIPRC